MGCCSGPAAQNIYRRQGFLSQGPRTAQRHCVPMCVYLLCWQPLGGHYASCEKSSACFPAPPLGAATVLARAALGAAGRLAPGPCPVKPKGPCPLHGPLKTRWPGWLALKMYPEVCKVLGIVKRGCRFSGPGYPCSEPSRLRPAGGKWM